MTECLKLNIPPLPQFLTGGYSLWPPGEQHFERTFDVYDLIFVSEGTLYMTEEEEAYSIRAGEMLLLEPGRKHVGHRASSEPTGIFWIHFQHMQPIDRLNDKEIVWSARVQEGRDSDLVPLEQYIYLPKFSSYDRETIEPILQELLQLRIGLTMEHAMEIQVLLGRLLNQLQASLRLERVSSRSHVMAQWVMQYLAANVNRHYHATSMLEELHFDLDYAARCLRKHTGLSPLQYHRMIRIEEVKRLLRQSTLSLQEIAVAMGFEDYNYFCRLFRKTTGSTPTGYRRAALGYV